MNSRHDLGRVVGAAELYAALAASNEHWRTGEVSTIIRKTERRRRAFYPWDGTFRELPFHVIVGPRQIGKTTTLGHLMQSLLDDGVRPERVVYAALDQPAVAAELDGFDPLVEVIERFLLRQPLTAQETPVHVFLDEVQALEGWPLHLKSLYDRFHPYLRVTATGSSAAALRNEPVRESVGRWSIDQLFPLKFNEAVEALHPDDFQPPGEAWTAAHAARLAIQSYDGDMDVIRRALDAAYAVLLPHHGRLVAAWDRYLIQGGYPASLLAPDHERSYVFLQGTLEAAINTDLRLFQNVRKPNQFRSFLAHLARSHGGKFNGANIAQDMGLQKETPARWKAIAEDLYLVRQLGAITHKGQQQPRRPDKAYMQDPGMRSYIAASNDLAALEASGAIGLVVEGVLFDHLLRLQFISMGGPGEWRCGYVDPPEIDFLLELRSAWIAVEGKYGERSRREVGEFRRRLERLQIKKPVLPIVISRDTYNVSEDVLVLPAWLFCYLV